MRELFGYRWRVLLALASLGALTGCVFGPVKKVHVLPLGARADVRGAHFDSAGRPELQPLGEGLLRGLERESGLHRIDPGGSESAFHLVADVPPAYQPGVSRQLTFTARLMLPDVAEPLGTVRWEGEGVPSRLLESAGREAGEALGREVAFAREQFFERRAADERLLIAPTPNTLRAGSIFISNDELLLFRAGIGVSKRVQLHGWLGGLGIPLAGGFALPLIHAVAAGGGAGLALMGVVDLGVKVRVLDETAKLPGVAVGYDFLDLFGGVLGTGALVLAGNGGAAIGGVGGAAANLQFNLFSLSASKHFGRTHVVAGAYLLDNHHFIPQVATIAAAGGTTGGTGTSGTETTVLERVPLQFLPFAAVEQVLGPHSALMFELFPRAPFRDTFGSSGVRWLLGKREPSGFLALDRIRARVDLSAVWVYLPGKNGRSGLVMPLPWLGLGLYVQ